LGATIGTCSPRRKSLALSIRPDLKIVPFRGNIQTRLDKIENEQVDATFLALAGIGRLGIEDKNLHPVKINDMLPAAGQGAICIETAVDDIQTQQYLEAINCYETRLCVSAERAVLNVLDGTCHTPIAAYATLKNDILSIRSYVGALDGSKTYHQQIELPCTSVEEAENMGTELGYKLKSIVPEDILRE